MATTAIEVIQNYNSELKETESTIRDIRKKGHDVPEQTIIYGNAIARVLFATCHPVAFPLYCG